MGWNGVVADRPAVCKVFVLYLLRCWLSLAPAILTVDIIMYVLIIIALLCHHNVGGVWLQP